MAIFVDNYPYPLSFQYNNQNCEKVYWNNNLVWPDPTLKYFWVEPDRTTYVKYTKVSGYLNVSVPKQLEYSLDGENWTAFNSDFYDPTPNEKIYFRSNDSNPFCVTGSGDDHKTMGISTSGSGAEVKIGGNIMSLFNNDTLPEHALEYFLCGLDVVNASKLIFPNVTSAYCYKHMFDDQSLLITPPVTLPSLTLSYQCYSNMFASCTRLLTTPTLPATTLAEHCYARMFAMCSSLLNVPTLPATTLADNCYESMFRQCGNLTTIPALPATVLTDNCYSYMFYMNTSLKFSETQTEECPNAFRIPTTGIGRTGTNSTNYMFSLTGGTFTGNPIINTTYYTNATVI